MAKRTRQQQGQGAEKDLIHGRDPLAGSAYERIRAAIRDRKLAPGSRVIESELASWLGVSRTPIREAILRLEQEGLLTQAPRQGLKVSELDYQAVIELYAMREVLEGAAASLAAQHASSAELDTLREMIAYEAGLTEAQADRAAAANRKFHRILHYAAHNRYLLKSLNALSDAMMLLGETTLGLPGRHATALDEHRAIVDAVAGRDSEAAERAARAHIREAQRHRVKMMVTDGEQDDV